MLKTGLWHHSEIQLYRNHDNSVHIQTPNCDITHNSSSVASNVILVITETP